MGVTRNKENYAEYIAIYGKIDSPLQVASYGVQCARMTGRTYAMIMALPDAPCVIVAYSHAWGKAIVNEVRRLRPDYRYQDIVIATKKDFDIDPISVMSGRQMPIFVDNSVIDMLGLDYVEKLNEAYGPKTQTIDLEREMLREIMQAAAESNWIPHGMYYMNDIVADVCRFLRTGKGANEE